MNLYKKKKTHRIKENKNYSHDGQPSFDIIYKNKLLIDYCLTSSKQHVSYIQDEKIIYQYLKRYRKEQDNPGNDLQDNPGNDLQDNPGNDLQDNPGNDLQDYPGNDLQDNPGNDL